MALWYLILFFCLVFLRQTPQASQVIVSTRYGTIKGLSRAFDKSIGLGNVSKVRKFLGVPYASPPINDLRFRPPRKPRPWKGVYDATKFKPVCWQDPQYNRMFWLSNFSWPQNEDCLYLNVYTPNTNAKIFYPVMVYIHGGGYEAGSPVVSPGDVLPLWDVVLVTIQYRLGPFGFISTGDSASPGNYGMLDQIEALKWIKENIRVFKGDPSKVTIFGESAGGSSVGLLLLSPLSKGLFHNAIALSGIDLSPFAVNTHQEAVQLSKVVAGRCKCPTTDTDKMISCIRGIKDPEKIFTMDDLNVWRPVVDNIFLNDTPINIRKAKTFHPYPLIVSMTSEEGSYFYQNITKTWTYKSFKKKLIEMYGEISRYNKTASPAVESKSIEDAIVFQYTPWPDIEDHWKLQRRLADLVTDYSVAAPAHAVLELHTMLAPGYLLVFSHRSKLSKDPKWKGVAHKADTPYQFGFPLMQLNVLQHYDEEDKKVSEFIIQYFTNFARTGNPTPVPVGGSLWKKFNKTNPYYMNLTIQPKSHQYFHSKGIAFWNSYFPKVLSLSCTKIDVLQYISGGSCGYCKESLFLLLCSIALFLNNYW